MAHLTFVAFFARKSRFTVLFVSMPLGLILVLCKFAPSGRPWIDRARELTSCRLDIVSHSIFLRFLLAALGVMNGVCERTTWIRIPETDLLAMGKPPTQLW